MALRRFAFVLSVRKAILPRRRNRVVRGDCVGTLMKILCCFGEFNYGDDLRGESYEYYHFFRAFKAMGHEVKLFDSWNRKKYPAMDIVNTRLVEEVESFRPDILFVAVLLCEIWMETIDYIRSEFGVRTVCWMSDDSWRFKEFGKFTGKHFDLVTTTYPDVVQGYRESGMDRVFLTTWGTNRENLRRPVPAKDCKYQVTFIGTAHGDRKEKIDQLKTEGIEVETFGHGWPNGAVASAEYDAIMHDSAISLNFANAAKGGNQIKGRTFEAPGMGSLLLTEPAENLENTYEIGREIDVFHNIRELAGKIKYYLDNPGIRDEVARRGYERTLRDYVYENTFKEIINEVMQTPQCNSKVNFQEALKRHELSVADRILKVLIKQPFTLVFGKKRGVRAARKVMYEISWRILGEKTFSAAGLPGKCFPEVC